MYTKGDLAYRNSGRVGVEAYSRPQQAEDTTIVRLYTTPEEVKPVTDAAMSVIRRSDYAVGGHTGYDGYSTIDGFGRLC